MIGNHVRLGADVKIMKGSVDDNTIIATEAILTDFVESNSIHAEVLAKKV